MKIKGMVKDSYGRSFKKLRISLLNTCNFACTYCVPEDNFMLDKKHMQLWDVNQMNTNYPHLSFPELTRIVEQLHEKLDFREIQLTGGEPLLYPRIISMVDFIKSLGIQTIKLTTNGLYLKKFGQKLRKAGLTGINLSLDAVDERVFQRITKRNYLNKVLESIDSVQDMGFNLKMNAVIMRGINEDQVIPLFEYACRKNIKMRYIELMNMGYLYQSTNDYFFSAQEILDKLSLKYTFNKLSRKPSSTANYWETAEGYQFGIIANDSFPFCGDCDRLRLDSQGYLYGCITAQKGINANKLNDEYAYRNALEQSLAQKQPVKFTGSEVSMLHLGG